MVTHQLQQECNAGKSVSKLTSKQEPLLLGVVLEGRWLSLFLPVMKQLGKAWFEQTFKAWKYSQDMNEQLRATMIRSRGHCVMWNTAAINLCETALQQCPSLLHMGLYFLRSRAGMFDVWLWGIRGILRRYASGYASRSVKTKVVAFSEGMLRGMLRAVWRLR